MRRQGLPLKTISYSDIRDLSVRDPAGRIRVSAGLCQTISYDTWVSRPGRKLLPSDFALVRIIKFLLTRFPCLTITKSQISKFGYYFRV
jgi:hypothetical protein